PGAPTGGMRPEQLPFDPHYVTRLERVSWVKMWERIVYSEFWPREAKVTAYRADLPILPLREGVYKLVVYAEGKITDIIYAFAGESVYYVIKRIRLGKGGDIVLQDTDIHTTSTQLTPLLKEEDITVYRITTEASLPAYYIISKPPAGAAEAIVVVTGGLSHLVYYNEVGQLESVVVI
ncbi:MAG: hypothetical protein ACP5KA_07580, partial [Desulfurococcaceae archaeon]